jgi:predicted transcriptional regulator
MATERPLFTTSIRTPRELIDNYDQLAKATGHARTYLMTAALEQYLHAQQWQLGELQHTIAAVESGEMATVDFEDLPARDLADDTVTERGSSRGISRCRGREGADTLHQGSRS